ncbi:hypothetical protein [Phaeobacter gallaeciensis]|uniref:hypothetical protein n=2 Tax=Phaeobacter TaxID=302485 RepID=UPI0015F0E7B8|nr:hypothetical protein [Phaeobacter gallaeciensis]
MDLRVGGVTEAKNLGAYTRKLQDFAQHGNISTTSKYMKDRRPSENKVAELRQAKS